MKKIVYEGEKGVFLPVDEFHKLQEKVLAQRELINELAKDIERIA